jgi:membrane protein implicated in regulation of membrane protease activity
MYAVVGLLLALSAVFLPSLGWFTLWLDSEIFKVLIFAVLWLIAPFVFRRFSSKQIDGKANVNTEAKSPEAGNSK